MLDLDQNRTPRGIPIEELCKHLFVCGVPGSGKTTGIFSILLQLYERGIPFLVIETVKMEYRTFKALREHPEPTVRGLADKLEVYTAGKEHVSPLRFNPLSRPDGIGPDAHIDAVLRCFKGAMPMFEPLPALLGEGLETVCATGQAEGSSCTMDDLYQASRRALAGKEYSGESYSNLSAALEVRLGMLTRRTLGAMLRTMTSVPDVAHLVASHCIIEMDELEVEVKCLLTLLLLSAIHRHVRLPSARGGVGNTNPRLVIVIEEAHNIVGRSTDTATAENHADPKAYATELICRMLAELRALGVGLILIDQLPSQVAPQVIKNTGTKLAFRQVAREDRQTLADTMLFGEADYEEIARLLPGEAYLFAEGYHRAHRLTTPNLAEILHLPKLLPDEELLALIHNEAWYQEAHARRAGDVLLRFRTAIDRYEQQASATRQDLEVMLKRQPSLAGLPETPARREAAHQLAASLERVESRIAAAFAALERGAYREARQLTRMSGQIESLQQSLFRRLEEDIRPQTDRLRDFVSKKVAMLKSGVFQTED